MGEKLALEKSRMSVGDSIQNCGTTAARSTGRLVATALLWSGKLTDKNYMGDARRTTLSSPAPPLTLRTALMTNIYMDADLFFLSETSNYIFRIMIKRLRETSFN